MKVRILGCGTSSGVPRIGNDWGALRSRRAAQSPRCARRSWSKAAARRLLVDCGPDLREQLLAAGPRRRRGVIVTHDHADHCHGIDDLRPIAQASGEPVPLLCPRRRAASGCESRFRYIFIDTRFYTASPAQCRSMETS